MIRSISLAAKLRLISLVVLFCLGGIKQALTSVPTPVLGADINDLIVETMLAKGMKASPKLSKFRKFLPCKAGLSVKPIFGTWKTVEVSCTDEGSWTIMVRTNLKMSVQKLKKSTNRIVQDKAHSKKIIKATAKVSKLKKQIEMMTVLALGRSMSRGDVIMPRDVITIAVPVHAASGVFFDPEDIIGRKLKTSVTAKKIIQARHLKPKWLVEEGDEVVIQNQAGGISVDMVGIALDSGQYGEWIKVKNVSSGIIVIGQIKNKKIISTNAKKMASHVVY